MKRGVQIIIRSERVKKALMEKIERLARQSGERNITLLKDIRISPTDKLGEPRKAYGKNRVVIA